MPSDRFQIAAERAASSCPTEVWLNLSASEQAAAIYHELRKLDAEFVLAQQKPFTTTRRKCPVTRQHRGAR
jgi:hypothetical protein